MTYCISIPVEATAGLSFQASASDMRYPAPGWTLNLFLRGPGNIDLVSDADAAAHRFSATPEQTASWTPGTYWWALRADNGAGIVLDIERGSMVVLPDLVAATPGFDGRSDNEKSLEAIDAVLAKRATLDQERYRINNRELYRTPIAELIRLRTYYATAVAREKRKAAGGGRWGRPIAVKFS